MSQFAILTSKHLERYLDSLPDTQPKGHGVYGRYAKDFYNYIITYWNGELSKRSIDGFFSDLVQKGRKEGTIAFIWGVVRRLFKVNDLPWPYRRSDGPVVREGSVFAPALSIDIIKDMINYVADSPRHAFYLAMSTTFGLREAELADLTRNSFNWRGEYPTVWIETKKAGRQRRHLIPPAIYPFVRSYAPKIAKPINIRTINRLYREIESGIGLEHIRGVAWHAIRRSLAHYLQLATDSEGKHLSQFVIRDFLRWKRPATDMAERYARVTMIDRASAGQTFASADRQIDEQVFRVHPFLPFWQAVLDSRRPTPPGRKRQVLWQLEEEQYADSE